MTSIEINSEDKYRLETSAWLAENINLIEEKKPFSALHWMPSRERENQHHLDCQQVLSASIYLTVVVAATDLASAAAATAAAPLPAAELGKE